jgi:hypothetical protein
MRMFVWAALCGPALLAAAPAGAQQSTTPDVCAQGQMRGADGQCIPGTGAGEAGNPGGGTAALEAAKGGAAAVPNSDDAPAAKSRLDPNAVGRSATDAAATADQTATMPNTPGAEPEATRFGAKVADPNAVGGSSQ